MKPVFRIVSPVLIAFLLMQLTLPFFFIQSKRNAFYKEAKKQMKKELAVKIPVRSLLADKNFRWEKQGKEFLFNGGLYDVACFKEENGEYFMYAVPDFAEKAFLAETAKKDPTSDDGVFSSAPFHHFPPQQNESMILIPADKNSYFVYIFPCITSDQLPEDSPPENMVYVFS